MQYEDEDVMEYEEQDEDEDVMEYDERNTKKPGEGPIEEDVYKLVIWISELSTHESVASLEELLPRLYPELRLRSNVHDYTSSWGFVALVYYTSEDLGWTELPENEELKYFLTDKDWKVVLCKTVAAVAEENEIEGMLRDLKKAEADSWISKYESTKCYVVVMKNVTSELKVILDATVAMLDNTLRTHSNSKYSEEGGVYATIFFPTSKGKLAEMIKKKTKKYMPTEFKTQTGRKKDDMKILFADFVPDKSYFELKFNSYAFTEKTLRYKNPTNKGNLKHPNWVCEDIAIAKICLNELDGSIRIGKKNKKIYIWKECNCLWSIDSDPPKNRLEQVITKKIKDRIRCLDEEDEKIKKELQIDELELSKKRQLIASREEMECEKSSMEAVRKYISNNNGIQNVWSRLVEMIVDEDIENKMDNRIGFLPCKGAVIFEHQLLDFANNTFSSRTMNDYWSWEVPCTFLAREDELIYAEKYFASMMKGIPGSSENKMEWKQFLQVVLGSFLTGNISAKAFYVFFGPTGGGKTKLKTMLDIIMGLGHFISPANRNTIIKSHHKNDISVGSTHTSFMYPYLPPTRLVCINEVQSGDEIAESNLSAISGDDTANYRGCAATDDKQKYVRFQCYVSMWTNNNLRFNPKVQSMLERLVVIPFITQFVSEPTEPNQVLKDSKFIDDLIKFHLDEIFTWIVRGACAWYKQGCGSIKRPALINKGHCIEDSQAVTLFSALYDEYKDLYPKATATAFGTALGKKFMKKQINGKQAIIGIRLKTEQDRKKQEKETRERLKRQKEETDEWYSLVEMEKVENKKQKIGPEKNQEKPIY